MLAKTPRTSSKPEVVKGTGSIRIGSFAIRVVHFNDGWRFWVFPWTRRLSDRDEAEFGLSPRGYDSLDKAKRAAKRAALMLGEVL